MLTKKHGVYAELLMCLPPTSGCEWTDKRCTVRVCSLGMDPLLFTTTNKRDISVSTINKSFCTFRGGRVDHTHVVAQLPSVYTFLSLNMSFTRQKKKKEAERGIEEMHMRLASFII